MEIILLIVGAGLGTAIGFLLFKMKNNSSNVEFDKKLAELNIEKNNLNQTLNEKQNQINEYKSELEVVKSELRNIEIDLAKSLEQNKNVLERFEEFKKQSNNIEEQFKTEFKNLASTIVKEQSKDFLERNESVLKPFREQLKAFEHKVQQQHEVSIKNAASFENQIKSLQEMNIKISQEATNLTKALKGDNKLAGNWGELVLERVLESSGLVKDSEYKTQVSLKDKDNNRLQPDAIVYLPDNKHIIIDSKVSLVAYENYVTSDDNDAKNEHLKNHILSIKNHIKNLSDKNYYDLPEVESPDFTLLFIPVEASFGVAVKEDVELFKYAWEKNIVIVSPSTLLATLKTVSSIWKQEKQNKNVLLIAEESGKLYDKFVGFLEDLDKIEEHLTKTQNFFSDSKKKLSTGNGNIIGKIEKLKELGAKAKKDIDPKFLD